VRFDEDVALRMLLRMAEMLLTVMSLMNDKRWAYNQGIEAIFIALSLSSPLCCEALAFARHLTMTAF